jgi:hypothetical protein
MTPEQRADWDRRRREAIRMAEEREAEAIKDDPDQRRIGEDEEERKR